jgi:hypothetical protein
VPKQELLDVSWEKRCEELEAAFRLVWAYAYEIRDHVTVIKERPWPQSSQKS